MLPRVKTRWKAIEYSSIQLRPDSPERCYPGSLAVPHRKSRRQSGSVAKRLKTSKGSSPRDGLESTADIKQQGRQLKETKETTALITEQMWCKKECSEPLYSLPIICFYYPLDIKWMKCQKYMPWAFPPILHVKTLKHSIYCQRPSIHSY